MTLRLLIAGGGLGGLAAAVAARHADCDVSLYEQASAFSEVGAGIQLGPNATSLLREWQLEGPLLRVCALPSHLVVRDACDCRVLGTLRLGRDIAQRYGAPYATIHRADLQELLLGAAQRAGAALCLDTPVRSLAQDADAVRVEAGGRTDAGDVLIGADGLWSAVRNLAWHDGPPRATGHLAYRALAAQNRLPAALRSNDVTVWLGPRLHVVTYPVRAGSMLNVVAIVEGDRPGVPGVWDSGAHAGELAAAMGDACTPLRDLVAAMPGWRVWVLHDRPPLQGAQQMARGRVALLGDAAHPMRPYFAQGAGMALEDAAFLGRVLRGAASAQVPEALRSYADARWARCARVQSRSAGNGRIFHATGVLRVARDAFIRVMGERALDQPWLYGWRGVQTSP